MTDQSFTSRFEVAADPDAVFAAICNVRGWWSEGAVGRADEIGDCFTHQVRDLHRCDLEVKEMVPGRRIVWHVLDNHFSFTRDATEWTGTHIVFELVPAGSGTEVRFTHVGLVPEYECHEVCVDGWTTYLASLRDLIATGRGRPNFGEARTGSEAALMAGREPSQAAA